MLILILKRFLTRRQFRFTRLLSAACILVFLVNVTITFFKQRQPFARRASITAEDLRSHIHSVYISSVQFNSEDILRAHWVPSLLQLVKELQAANITTYVSIYENHSLDGTKSVLSDLALTLKNLSVDHTIYLDTETRATVIEQTISSQSGWLKTRYGKEMRRIVYLAGVRNRALEPLQALKKKGVQFDKILFLNDVIYTVCSSGPAKSGPVN